MTSGLDEVGGLMDSEVVCLDKWFIYWIPNQVGNDKKNAKHFSCRAGRMIFIRPVVIPHFLPFCHSRESGNLESNHSVRLVSVGGSAPGSPIGVGDDRKNCKSILSKGGACESTPRLFTSFYSPNFKNTKICG